MFWILRRTGAANFFNSFNNNCNTSKNNSSSSGSSNGSSSTNDKYSKRPSRKSYGRLSVDSDDGSLIKHKIDDLGNFEMIASGEINHSGCPEQQLHEDNHGNFVDDDLSDLELDVCGTTLPTKPSTLQQQQQQQQQHQHQLRQQKELNENTLNRLQSMAMSDDDDYDESLTCNVCDRAFHCHRQLASHQQKKRHFGCGGCDSLFPSLMLLEHHKEEFEHWSDDEFGRRTCCRRNRGDDYFTDTDSFTSEAESEDLERLL